MIPTAFYKYSAILALILSLALPFLRFYALMDEDIYKIAFLLASAAWFLAATTWSARRKKDSLGAGDAEAKPDSGPPER